VRWPTALRARLRHLASEELSVYRDTYYDRPGRELTAQGRGCGSASWRPAGCAVHSLMRLWQVQEAGRLGELAPDRQVWP
jgi:hypothetical protein